MSATKVPHDIRTTIAAEISIVDSGASFQIFRRAINRHGSQDVIVDHTLIEAGANKPSTVGTWAYPRGGKPLRGIAQVDGVSFGIALSIAKKS